VASTTYNGNGGIAYSSSNTVTPAYPALQANDILILQVVTDTTNTHNQPTNWENVFEDYANGDFRLKSTDTDLIDNGVDDPGGALFSDDIIGTTRGV
jgi:hypothetical protein